MKHVIAKLKQSEFLIWPFFVFLWFHLLQGTSKFLGVVLFFSFLYIVGGWWRQILKRVFFIKANKPTTHILSWFSVFTLLGYMVSICIVWYHITSVLLFACYVVTALLSFLLSFFVRRKKQRKKSQSSYEAPEKKFRALKIHKIVYIIYISLWGAAIFLLANGRSSAVLQSPWQAISSYYLPVFFLLSVVLGVLLVSKYKTKTLLFFVILYSFLVHAYLPLSHMLPWGGDVWRTIGIEQKIQQEEFIYPVLFGHNAEWVSTSLVSVPRIFTAPHKYVYGHLWGESILLSETLHIDLLYINIWLVPILWSLLLPLIFFRIGKILFGSPRYGLWFSALTCIPFSLQALGGLTLAVSLGTIVFFFTLMLWLQYLRERVPWQRRIVLLFAVLSLFGYTLYALLIWFVIIVSVVFSFIQKRVKNSLIKKSLITVIAFLSIFLFPFIELFSKISFVPENLQLMANIKQFLGQFSGWYYAWYIRPHDILSGNIIFNHTPVWAFVENIFTTWRYHLMLLMIAIAFGIVIKLVHLLIEEERQEWHVMSFVFMALFGGYVLGWFVLEGDRSFIRRLDPALAVWFILFAFSGWMIFFKKADITLSRRYRPVVYICLILFLSWSTTTILASGPDMRVVSQSEYAAAQKIVSNQSDEEVHCILADTWVLLAVEALSSGNIVGGGFPIDYQFSQPERIVLYAALLEDPRKQIFEVAKNKTGASQCVIAVPTEFQNEEKMAKIREITEEPGESVGNIFIAEERLNIVLE
jgi:hypothetical protein